MAEIFLARQLGLGGFNKELVIKRIHRELATNVGYVEMFLDEARIAANLNHPNIVHIYDIGKAFGTYYIAMEYIHGKDLMEICRRGIAQKQFLSLRLAVAIVGQVAQGLAYAQAHRGSDGQRVGIVHRDISPTNILVSYTGIAKLVDFGIARAASQVAEEIGTVVGKLSYMAPEQVRGELVDGRTDLFALGVVLYEITVGRRLFRGSRQEVMDKILTQPIAPPSLVRPGFPPDLEQILMRLLEKRPENRYSNGGELHQDLEAFASSMGWRSGRHHLSRYLIGLFDVTGVGIEVDPDEEVEEDEDDLDFDSPRSGSYDQDFAQAEEGELIFASRMDEEVSPGDELLWDGAKDRGRDDGHAGSGGSVVEEEIEIDLEEMEPEPQPRASAEEGEASLERVIEDMRSGSQGAAHEEGSPAEWAGMEQGSGIGWKLVVILLLAILVATILGLLLLGLL